MANFSDSTPLSFLTVGDLRRLIAEAVRTEPEKRYVKGMAGIMEIFRCSRTTADKIKASGVIDAAIIQTRAGGTFTTNVEQARELFKLHNGYLPKGVAD